MMGHPALSMKGDWEKCWYMYRPISLATIGFIFDDVRSYRQFPGTIALPPPCFAISAIIAFTTTSTGTLIRREKNIAIVTGKDEMHVAKKSALSLKMLVCLW